MKKRKAKRILRLNGMPNEKQKLFFASTASYIAYGGARGGGKSWALRRKIVLMSIRYAGLRSLIIRRSYPELYGNHVLPLSAELNGYAEYSESKKTFLFPNGSTVRLGYCSSESDVLQYQGQEYDVIAIDEATQLTEFQFNTLKACMRGMSGYPKRMYLTCNPGGVGHSWVKRLFVDRIYRENEKSDDYDFIPAKASDNTALMEICPDYTERLKSIADEKLRRAWLDGDWDVFEGQYFAEFDRSIHCISPKLLCEEDIVCRFCGMDYGFDMLAVLWLAVCRDGKVYVYREFCRSGLTLSQAAEETERICGDEKIEYIAASPDLWNRRQDSGYSGIEIMQRAAPLLPSLIRADNRRVIGWLNLREYLKSGDNGVRLEIFACCRELIRCLPALVYDHRHPDDASDEPHSVTHTPEALRYALMSRCEGDSPAEKNDFPDFSISCHDVDIMRY